MDLAEATAEIERLRDHLRQKSEQIARLQDTVQKYHRASVETSGGTGPWEFDRYRDGQLKAEGIRITRARSLEQATRAAARIADRGDVLVLRQDEPGPVQRSPWRPSTKDQPEGNGHVLAWDTSEPSGPRRYAVMLAGLVRLQRRAFTHWMPLPSPPGRAPDEPSPVPFDPNHAVAHIVSDYAELQENGPVPPDMLREVLRERLADCPSWPMPPAPPTEPSEPTRCGQPFTVDGEEFICSLKANHQGGCGRIEMLRTDAPGLKP